MKYKRAIALFSFIIYNKLKGECTMTFIQNIYIEAIEKYKKEYGEVPTIRKIAYLVGVNSRGTVGGMLKRL